MKPTEKDPAAVALGRKGGTKRAANLTADELSKQGRKAARARWKKARDAAKPKSRAATG
jgi:hypothetical protein